MDTVLYRWSGQGTDMRGRSRVQAGMNNRKDFELAAVGGVFRD